MIRRNLSSSSFAVAVLLALSAFAQSSAPTTAPDPAVDAILGRLHDVGASLKTLRADVTLKKTDVGTDENSTRAGTILIERRGEGDTRAHIDLTKVDTVVDGKIRRVAEHREYLLDGDWMTDRVYKRPGTPSSEKNQETRRQIRAPGTKTDLLKLGAGPFPLPIGQTKEAVRQQFDAAAATADEAHAGLNGVTLTPLPGTSLASKFHSITVWLAPKQSMPSVIETLNKDQAEKQTTTLANVVLNAPAADADFKLPAIQNPADWKLEEQSYQP